MHPAKKFTAPKCIKKGFYLSSLMNCELIELLSLSIKNSYPSFNSAQFLIQANNNLHKLTFKERARHISICLQHNLPEDFSQSSTILINSFGPELKTTSNFGLQVYFYLPHSEYISNHSKNYFQEGMKANYELTKRFTAEYSIRNYISSHFQESIKLIQKWTQDPNPHVRRLCSEGTRSRLPWSYKLNSVATQPRLIIPILESLKDDPSLYVRRSVANNLADIGKDHIDILLTIADQWVSESEKLKSKEKESNRKFIIRHSLRYPSKKGNKEAIKLRNKAK